MLIKNFAWKENKAVFGYLAVLKHTFSRLVEINA